MRSSLVAALDADGDSAVGVLTVKQKDAWWTVAVIDPIAASLLHVLCGIRWITPNRLSVASLIVALAAGSSLATGDLILGGLLFQLSFLLDCMDGKLAHSRGQLSEFGGWIDSVVDAARLAVCYGGLIWSLAGTSELGRADMLVAGVYPLLGYAVIVTGSAWPRRDPPTGLILAASPLAFARALPHRLGTPASSVDAEAVVFTLGPLLGQPVIGIWVGAAFNLVHLLVSVGVRGAHVTSRSRRLRPRGAREAQSERAPADVPHD
jgi:hypothetical protein